VFLNGTVAKFYESASGQNILAPRPFVLVSLNPGDWIIKNASGDVAVEDSDMFHILYRECGV